MSIANCFRHPPCHSAICHRSNFSIPSRWQAQHNAFDQPPHHSAIRHLIPPSTTPFRHPPPDTQLFPPSATSFQSQFFRANFDSVKVASSTYHFDQPPHLIPPSITHSAIHHKSSVPISPFCQDSKLDIPLLISLPSHSTICHVIPPSVTDQFPPYSSIHHKSLGPISPHHQGTKVTKLYIPILIRTTTLTESED